MWPSLLVFGPSFWFLAPLLLNPGDGPEFTYVQCESAHVRRIIIAHTCSATILTSNVIIEIIEKHFEFFWMREMLQYLCLKSILVDYQLNVDTVHETAPPPPFSLGGKQIWGTKVFDFRRITLFIGRYRLSKHKMTISCLPFERSRRAMHPLSSVHHYNRLNSRERFFASARQNYGKNFVQTFYLCNLFF